MSLFFGSNPFDDLVERATSENLPLGEVDIALNLDIADKIKSKQVPPKQAALAIKRRLLYKNPNVQLLALKLVDTCAKNSGSHFLTEVAARDFMDTLVSLGGSLQLTDLVVRKAALALIQNWGISFKGKPGLSYVVEIYDTLKREGVPFPPVELAEVSSIMIDTITAPEWSESDVCMRCRTEFTTFTRKHHCRNCGQTFCHSCSSKTAPLHHLGITEAVRVCDGCNLKLMAKAAGATTASPYAPAATAARTGTNNVDSAARKEQEDLERAIAASLMSSGSPAPVKQSSAPKKQAFVDEEEDEDLKAAIEASLRDLNISENKNSSNRNTANDYPEVSGGSTFAGFGGYPDQPQQQQGGAEAAVSPAGPNANELSRVELDNLKLFSDLVERMEADVKERGIGVMSHSQISTLYSQLFALQPKLQWSLDNAVTQYRQSMETNEKVSDSLQMYDRMLQERLNSGAGAIYGGAPQQPYWGAAPPQQAAGYYGASPQPFGGFQPGPPAQLQQGWAPGNAPDMYAQQPPQQYGAPPMQQEYGAPPPPMQQDPAYQQYPPQQYAPDPYQQQQQQDPQQQQYQQTPPNPAGYMGAPPQQQQQQQQQEMYAPIQQQPLQPSLPRSERSVASPPKQSQTMEALSGLQFAPTPVTPVEQPQQIVTSPPVGSGVVPQQVLQEVHQQQAPVAEVGQLQYDASQQQQAPVGQPQYDPNTQQQQYAPPPQQDPQYTYAHAAVAGQQQQQQPPAAATGVPVFPQVPQHQLPPVHQYAPQVEDEAPLIEF
ncbi:Vacuolar protein-sorting-associated protein 27 [Podochytrium sp. JEL0797]|nr:Vacuolar protein-sorting-associated protein 27 [Podochytrium sp. JEL0797]